MLWIASPVQHKNPGTGYHCYFSFYKLIKILKVLLPQKLWGDFFEKNTSYEVVKGWIFLKLKPGQNEVFWMGHLL